MVRLLAFRIRCIYKPALSGHALYTDRCRAFSMTTRSQGRLIFLKYFIVSTVTVSILTIVVLRLVMPTGESLPNLSIRILHGLADNSVFLLVQTLMTLIGIWFLGGLVTTQIQKRKNVFVIGGLAFLTLWLILFVSSTLTASTIDAIEINDFYFGITLSRWTNYHLIPFLEIGLVYGLCLRYFMGREIKNRVVC